MASHQSNQKGDSAGSAGSKEGRRGSAGSANESYEPKREVLEYIGEPHFAKNEKLNQALIGEPFVTGPSPAGGESIHARGPNYQVTVENTDAKLPRAAGYINEPASGSNEKRFQSLIGDSFITGVDPASGPLASCEKIGDPEITSGNLKDNEDGVMPVVLGGHYGYDYAKPTEELDFDTEHGHKTDIPWQSGEGSGFDRDWEDE